MPGRIPATCGRRRIRPHRLWFCPSLLAPVALAQNQAKDLPCSLVERLCEEVPELQLPARFDGLRQAYRDESLRLDGTRIDSLLAAHEALLAAPRRSRTRSRRNRLSSPRKEPSRVYGCRRTACSCMSGAQD